MYSDYAQYDAPRHPSPDDAFRSARAIFLDWDGCVMIGGRLISMACDLLARHRDRVIILSNNSTHLPVDFAHTLQQVGISLPPERIILAGTEAVRLAAENHTARTMLLGSPRLKEHARLAGINLVRDGPDQILLTRDTRFTYAKLCRVVAGLQHGAELIVANSDRTHPGADGAIVPETGALLAAIRACVPEASITMIGKPEPLLFARACAVAQVSPHQAVMIGDNPDTDALGARDYGVFPILIGPHGEVSLEDMLSW